MTTAATKTMRMTRSLLPAYDTVLSQKASHENFAIRRIVPGSYSIYFLGLPDPLRAYFVSVPDVVVSGCVLIHTTGAVKASMCSAIEILKATPEQAILGANNRTIVFVHGINPLDIM